MNNQYKIFQDIEEKLQLNWDEMLKKYLNERITKKWSTSFICCPFHWEDTPSFWISTWKKVMKCFWCWKFYNSILLFIKDYKNFKTNEMIDVLIQDWYINDIEILWKNLKDYIEYDIKKSLYEVVENHLPKNDPIFKRIVFYQGWIGKINKNKLDLVKNVIEKKYNKNNSHKNIADKILKDLEKNIDNYALLLNEYNNILFYTWLNLSNSLSDVKYVIPGWDVKEIKYLGTESLRNNLEAKIKEKDIIQNIQTHWEYDIYDNYIKWKIKTFNSKWFNEYITNNLSEISTNEYYTILSKLFTFKSDYIDVVLWEWFFDVYLTDLYALPFFSYWTNISSDIQKTFVKYMINKLQDKWQKIRFNLINDIDRTGILANVRFINNYLKTTYELSNKENIDLVFFDFDQFNSKIKKFLTILKEIMVTSKKNNDIINKFRKINATYNSVLSYDSLETWFFEIFSNLDTNYSIISQIKSKFMVTWQFNENDKWKNTIKDFWDITYVLNAIFYTLNILKKQLKKDDYYYIQEIIIGTFKKIFIKSYRNYYEIKNIVEYKKSDKTIKEEDLSFLQKDWNYIFNKGGWSSYWINFSNSLTRNLSYLQEHIDLELNYLVLFNFLNKDKKINDSVKAAVLIKQEIIDRINKFVKSNKLIKITFYERCKHFINNIKEEDSLDNTNIKLFLYILLLYNYESNFKDKDYDKIKIIHYKLLLLFEIDDHVAQDIAFNNNNNVVHKNIDKINIIKEIIDHFIEIKDILLWRIQIEINEHGKEGNFIDWYIFDIALWEFIHLASQKPTINKDIK